MLKLIFPINSISHRVVLFRCTRNNVAQYTVGIYEGVGLELSPTPLFLSGHHQPPLITRIWLFLDSPVCVFVHPGLIKDIAADHAECKQPTSNGRQHWGGSADWVDLSNYCIPIDVLICYQIIAVVAPCVCVYISIHVVIRRHSCGLTCVLNMSLQFPHLDGIANTSWVVVLTLEECS